MKNLLILEKWTPLVPGIYRRYRRDLVEISEEKNAPSNDNRCITSEQILW